MTPSIAQRGRRLANTRPALVAFLAFFALVLAVRWPTLDQPPVWDAAMSIYPAAITIAESGTDLLAQPGYGGGGPNVHPISPVTWVNAGLILVFGEVPIVLLHLLHFVMAAAAFAVVYSMLRPLLGTMLAALTAVAALAFPVVLTQAGYVYLEIPLLLATVLAVKSWVDGRLVSSALWVSLAVMIKPAGAIVAGGLALASLARPSSRSRPIRELALLLIPATVLLALHQLATPLDAETIGPIDVMLRITTWYFVRLSDVVVLFALLVGAGAMRLFTELPAKVSDDYGSRLMASHTFLIISFAFFYIVLPLFGRSSPILPRYFVQILPFALALLVILLSERSRVVATVAVVASMVFSVVNADGRLYPQNDLNNFALIERSGAYRSLLDLQLQAMTYLEDVPADVPIFYGRPSHYRASYPMMGYVSEKLTNGILISHVPPYSRADLTEFPDEFVLYFEYPWLGGELVWEVWEQAKASRDHSVGVTSIRSGQFNSSVVHVLRSTSPSPGR